MARLSVLRQSTAQRRRLGRGAALHRPAAAALTRRGCRSGQTACWHAPCRGCGLRGECAVVDDEWLKPGGQQRRESWRQQAPAGGPHPLRRLRGAGALTQLVCDGLRRALRAGIRERGGDSGSQVRGLAVARQAPGEHCRRRARLPASGPAAAAGQRSSDSAGTLRAPHPKAAADPGAAVESGVGAAHVGEPRPGAEPGGRHVHPAW